MAAASIGIFLFFKSPRGTGFSPEQTLHLEFSNKDLWKGHRRSLDRHESRYLWIKVRRGEGTTVQAAARPRGTVSIHRDLRSKSYRLRLPLESYEMGPGHSPSYLDLVISKDQVLSSQFALGLQEQLGLPTLYRGMKAVFENGNYSGVKEIFEQYSDAFLARNRLPLGPVFKEFNATRHIWNPEPNPPETTWGKLSAKSSLGFSPLERLMMALHSKSVEQLGRILDISNMIPWSQHHLIMGCGHQAATNLRFYFHPGLQKFQQWPWDIPGLYDGSLAHHRMPLDFVHKDHLAADLLIRNPGWREARNQALYDLIKSGSIEESLEHHFSKVRELLRHDPQHLRFFAWRQQLFNTRRQWWNKRKAFLLKALEPGKVDLSHGPKAITVRCYGTVGLTLKGFLVPMDIETKAWPDRLRVSGTDYPLDRSGNGVWLQKNITFAPRATDQKATCLLGLSMDIQPAFKGEVIDLELYQGEKQITERWYPQLLKPYDLSPCQWTTAAPSGQNHQQTLIVTESMRLDEPTPTSTTWDGEISLDRDVTILKHQTLIVEPGTKIRCNGDVAIKVFGSIKLKGTAHTPIVFEAADSQRPWKCLAINGAKVLGAEISHLKLSGAKGSQEPECLYNGTFNIVHVEPLSLHHITVSDCPAEDGLNVKRCDVVLSQSSFLRCNDGLDFDFCRAEVDNCSFSQNLNDGLDLGSVICRGRQLSFEGNGDKRLSVGGESKVFIEQSRAVGNNIAIAVKDNSAVNLKTVDIHNNKIGIVSFNKSKMFESYVPSLNLETCSFSNNQASAITSKRARVTLVDTHVPLLQAQGPDWDSDIQSLFQ
jgi:hypothetical protein